VEPLETIQQNNELVAAAGRKQAARGFWWRYAAIGRAGRMRSCWARRCWPEGGEPFAQGRGFANELECDRFV